MAIGEEALPAATIGSTGADANQAHKIFPRRFQVKDQICTWTLRAALASPLIAPATHPRLPTPPGFTDELLRSDA
jgi:hypothetical protein